ncbi:MAG: alpha/beta hydrolase [Planctomycetota bacterium]
MNRSTLTHISLAGTLLCAPFASAEVIAASSAARSASISEPADGPALGAAKTIETDDGVTLTVYDAGEGDPVILLAGGPGFAGIQMLPIAQSVRASHRGILMDQRGTGASEVDEIDPAAFTIDRSVADLNTVVDTLELDSVTLIGHSWGAVLSMAYAAEHPERVASMVLVGPAGIDASFWAAYQGNIQQRLGPQDMQTLSQIPQPEQTLEGMAEYSREVNKAIAHATLGNKDAAEALRAEMALERFNPRVSLAMQGALQSFDFREQLKTFEAPVLVIQGDEDPIGRPVADRIVETMPNATLEIIEACGHWPFLEHKDDLNRRIDAFLAGND